MVKYLVNNEIDKTKWDNTVSISQNALVYACSWYLDAVSPDWDALVLDDYDVIMPVTVKSKYGLKYIIQPAFTQQLGIFYKKERKEVISDFIKILSEKYGYININLNYQNCRDIGEKFELRINTVLNLNEGYEFIYNNFSTNAKRNIKKAGKENLVIAGNVDYQRIFKFKRDNAQEKISHSNYRSLDNILRISNKLKKGEGFAVYNSSNKLLSAVYLIKEFNRIIFLISVSNDEAKEKSAMFLLVDHILKKYAGQNYTFDFEGGTISGIRRFFEGFGASHESYPNLKINNLPWPLKLLKK